MFKTRLFTIAVGMMALFVGVGPAKADVMFGNQQPAAGGPCVAVAAGDQGAVCPSNQLVFNDPNGGTITTNGFVGAPGTSGSTFLTLKANTPNLPTLPQNAPNESGLGTNAVGPATPPSPCTDTPDCEIFGSNSVTAVASSTLKITDAIIGSVQAGELFNFFIETSMGGPFMELTGGPFSSTCTGNPTIGLGPFTESCVWNSASPSGVFGIAVEEAPGGSGADDILLTAVSTTSVPAPLIGHGPFVLLAIGGVLFGARLLERSRKRRSFGAA